MNERALKLIEDSFLSSLLSIDSITDVSYNGESIYYQDNIEGRKKSDILIDKEAVLDFIRQLANLSEQLFSFSNPLLDISVGNYRINAVHQSIGRHLKEKTVTFSLRIAKDDLKIKSDDSFLSKACFYLLNSLIFANLSIVISGRTGTGKTELQKYLISLFENNTRVIIIDNVLELDVASISTNIDVTNWQVSEYSKDASFQSLIRNALRANPDWLIVAESRGKEMIDVLNSAMTGHAIITTIHSLDVFSIPSRMARMVLMGDKELRYEDVLKDIKHHFRFFVYLERYFDSDGHIRRRIKSVGEIFEDGKMHLLYHISESKEEYSQISDYSLKNIMTNEKAYSYYNIYLQEINR